ncbi:MAG: hypothetical protein KJ044_15435, partial [Planctomycetes bacterium]|nr:hypothetical protein [Planctomycetota bacterium]
MADVITFSCNQCHTPYRVAAANAGRAFACKSCGTQLVVPQASTPPAPIVVPQDPEVQLGAGEQVIRKTDSARRASVDPTRMITRNSGAHLAVRHAPTAVAAPAAKSGRGLLIGAIAGGVVVVALVAGLWAAGVFSGKPAAGPGTNTPNIAANAPAANTPKERSEREQIMLELGAPGRTPASMIALYKRAVAARLDKADLSVVARAAVDQVANENMSGLTEDEVLDFGQQLERDGYVTEPGRLYLLVSRRWLGKADPPPAFERAQKLRKLEKLDFTPLLSRADEILQSGVLDSAKPLRDELVKMSEESESGWVSAETAARFAEIDRTLGDQQAEVERLKRENPFLFVAARARHHFNSQRVASRSAWGVHVSEPLVIY